MPNLTYSAHDAILASWGDLTLGVLTAAPNPDGTGVTEPSPSDGYERQAMTYAKGQADGVTTITNDENIVFGPATPTSWTTVTYWGLFDENDVLKMYGRMRTARTNPTGEVLAFPAGTVEVRLR